MRRGLFAVLVSVLLFAGSTLGALTYWKSGGASPADWNAADNWSNGVPADGKDAIFDADSATGDCNANTGVSYICDALVIKSNWARSFAMVGGKTVSIDSIEVQNFSDVGGTFDSGNNAFSIAGGVYVNCPLQH